MDSRDNWDNLSHGTEYSQKKIDEEKAEEAKKKEEKEDKVKSDRSKGDSKDANKQSVDNSKDAKSVSTLKDDEESQKSGRATTEKEGEKKTKDETKSKEPLKPENEMGKETKSLKPTPTSTGGSESAQVARIPDEKTVKSNEKTAKQNRHAKETEAAKMTTTRMIDKKQEKAEINTALVPEGGKYAEEKTPDTVSFMQEDEIKGRAKFELEAEVDDPMKDYAKFLSSFGVQARKRDILNKRGKDAQTEIQKHAHESFENCGKACKEEGACFQWVFSSKTCKLGMTFRLGRYMKPSDDNKVVWKSGWMMERVKKWTEEHKCTKPEWLKL